MFPEPATETPDLVESWPYTFQQIETDSPLYEYLSIYATELARLDAFIDELYEQRFIETATGVELTQLGAPLGVKRRADETDEQFRYRLKLRKAVASSNGTAEDIRGIITQAFDDDATSEITVGVVEDAPVLLFIIPPDLLADVPITSSQLSATLNSAMPCGSGVQIVSGDDIFTFYEDDTDAASYEAGFGEGVWTG